MSAKRQDLRKHLRVPVLVLTAVALVVISGLLLSTYFRSDDSEDKTRSDASSRADTAGGTDDPLGRLRSADGYTLQVDPHSVAIGRPTVLSLTILGPDDRPEREFELEQTKRLHLLLVRRDLTGYQHLHPRMDARGEWHQRLRLAEPGPYRLYADFKVEGKRRTLSTPIGVPGLYSPTPLPLPKATASVSGGYRVKLDRKGSVLVFRVYRNGAQVQKLQSYLGARGHLVGIRKRDAAYLHTHAEAAKTDPAIRFSVSFPSREKHRLFLQFRHERKVRTAEFTLGGESVAAGGHDAEHESH